VPEALAAEAVVGADWADEDADDTAAAPVPAAAFASGCAKWPRHAARFGPSQW